GDAWAQGPTRGPKFAVRKGTRTPTPEGTRTFKAGAAASYATPAHVTAQGSPVRACPNRTGRRLCRGEEGRSWGAQRVHVGAQRAGDAGRAVGAVGAVGAGGAFGAGGAA